MHTVYRYLAARLLMFTVCTGITATVHGQSPPIDSFNPGANGSVYAVALLPAGKIYVGGAFGSISGQTQRCLARLHADGTLDTNVNFGSWPVGGTAVHCLCVQPDGKLLVGGSFTSLARSNRKNLGRFNPDTTLDLAFNPVVECDATYGTNTFVAATALQRDGKILVGGQNLTNIARLNPDGSLDNSFSLNANDVVYSIAVQIDGKILVGGAFTKLGAHSRNYIARINQDGSIDQGFNPGADGPVYCVASETDGKIIVGGYFSTLGACTRHYIGRLNPDGSIDPMFNASLNGPVYSMALRCDGKILIGGLFTSINGHARTNLACLKSGRHAGRDVHCVGR